MDQWMQDRCLDTQPGWKIDVYTQPEWRIDVYIHNLNGGEMSVYTTWMKDRYLYTQPEWRIDVYIHNLNGGEMSVYTT